VASTSTDPFAIAGAHWTSISDGANYYGVSPRTVRRLIAAGRLKAYRIGPRIIRLDKAELDSVMQPIPTASGDVA
jgi:excisionase family DNA binding protein